MRQPIILLTHTPLARRNYYGERALAGLNRLGEVRLHEGDAPLGPTELVAAASGARIIVADRATSAPAEVFAALPDLVAFVRVAVDISTVDVSAASAAGVLVTRAGPGFAASVAELVLGFMVDLARGITVAAMAFRNGTQPSPTMGRQLAGSTLGIIGYGVIGQRLAALGAALDMQVLVADPHAAIGPGLRHVALADLLAAADFVVCLAAATPDTENLMDAAAFAGMRRNAFFINASRGALIDEEALAAALRTDRIAGAALDVGRAADQMPSALLASSANVLATPHIGGLTPPAIESQALETVEQVGALLRGDAPPGAVNASSWMRSST